MMIHWSASRRKSSALFQTAIRFGSGEAELVNLARAPELDLRWGTQRARTFRLNRGAVTESNGERERTCFSIWCGAETVEFGVGALSCSRSIPPRMTCRRRSIPIPPARALGCVSTQLAEQRTENLVLCALAALLRSLISSSEAPVFK